MSQITARVCDSYIIGTHIDIHYSRIFSRQSSLNERTGASWRTAKNFAYLPLNAPRSFHLLALKRILLQNNSFSRNYFSALPVV